MKLKDHPEKRRAQHKRTRGPAAIIAALALILALNVSMCLIAYADTGGAEDPSPEQVLVVEGTDGNSGYTLSVIGEDNDATMLTDMSDSEVPLAMPIVDGGWGILNLILMLLTCSLAAMSLYPAVKEISAARKRDDGNSGFAPLILAAVTLIPAVISVVSFIMTEDFSAGEAIADRNTVLMGEIFLIELVTAIYARFAL